MARLLKNQPLAGNGRSQRYRLDAALFTLIVRKEEAL